MSTEPILLLTAAFFGVVCALAGIPAAVLKGSFASAFPTTKTLAPVSSFQASAKPVLGAGSASAFAAPTAHITRTG